jgi:ubiquinone/menaquinone biosynthesis C-methylase UbiE
MNDERDRIVIKSNTKYISALSYDSLTPLYDLAIRLTMPESKFRRRLVKQADIREHHRVLDLGCGTGTLTILIKKTHPYTEVSGLDGDQKILDIARAKAAKAEVELTFSNGMAFELPYPDGSFDRVVSSLVFHHLTRENKVRTLQEVFRVLRPDGELHVADWGKPQNLLMRLASLPLRMFDGLETTRDNVKGLLPEMFQKAGFDGVQEPTRFLTLFGTLSLYKARKSH